MTEAAVPALLVGCFLIVSGTLKLRPGGGIPPARFLGELTGSVATPILAVAVAAVAVAEVVLGAGLLASRGGSAIVVVSVVDLFLVVAAVLVAVALRRKVGSACGCLGASGAAVGVRDLVRNLVLLGLAVAATFAAADGVVPASAFGPDQWCLVGVLVAAGVLAWSLLPAAPAPRRPVPTPSTAPDPLEYVRLPIPAATVWSGGTSSTLHALVADQPALLVFAEVTAGVPAGFVGLEVRRRRLDPVQLMLVVAGPTLPVDVGTAVWRDPGWSAVNGFGFAELPAAVLLGADGWTAGGPAYGWGEIDELADLIGDTLAEARATD